MMLARGHVLLDPHGKDRAISTGNFHIGETYFVVSFGPATVSGLVLLGLALVTWLRVRSRR